MEVKKLDKQTIGVIIALLGLVSFIQSFSLKGNPQYVYLVIGIVLIIGGIIYAKK